MWDTMMILATIIFFAVAIAYARACVSGWGKTMTIYTILLLTVVVFLFAYLIVALLRPEQF